MNKKLLAVAVGSTLMFGAAASAVAAPTVYGRAIAFLENCSTCNGPVGGDESWGMNPGGSRLGFKGSEDLGGGLKGIYQFEFGIDTDGLGVGQTNGTNNWDGGDRPKWVGLEGSFGAVKLGRQFGPEYLYVGAMGDLFSEGMIRNSLGVRFSDMVAYNSPKIGPADLMVAAITEGSNNNLANNDSGNPEDAALDEYQVGARLGFGPATVAATVTSVENATFGDSMGLSASYKIGPALIVAAFENVEASATTETETARLVGQVRFGDSEVVLGYAKQETDDVTAEPTTLKAEYRYFFSKATRVWAAWTDSDDDDSVDDEEANIQLGLRVDF